jgi:glucosamine kinase
MHHTDCVVGIDGGGSFTRVAVADLQGNVLSYTEHGASSIHKDAQATNNVREGIAAALAQAGRDVSDVKALVAGIAGYDSENDLPWVEELTALPGIDCPRGHVNDAVIAHAGAFQTKPGIVVISGTGSIILAVTEDGRHIRNYDMHHYAASAARFLSYDLVHELLAGYRGPSDTGLVRQTLDYWGAADMKELRDLALSGFSDDRRDRNALFGRMAPIVTTAALEGSALARSVCDRKVHEVAVGVRMLGACFDGEHVPVACIGSVINSTYMKQKFTEACAAAPGDGKRYLLSEPVLSPVSGAVMMAYNRMGIAWEETTVRNLLNSALKIRNRAYFE